MAMNVATAAPSGRENEAKKGMKAAGFGIPGIPKEILKNYRQQSK